MELSQSLEDYLEQIHVLTLNKGVAKVTDIATALNVKKSSVNSALNSLQDKKLISYIPYSPITLTEKGEKYAKDILKKHNLISNFFQNILFVNEKEALDVACKVEHVISNDISIRLNKFSKFIQSYSKENENFKEEINRLF
ncbi:MAG: metal-dependent transcriptional regulator [Candidatus Gastranaerophilales bacterium]